MKKEVANLLKTIPKSLKVGAYDFTVSTFPDFLVGPDEQQKWGLCSFSELKLSVGNTEGMPSSQMFVGVLLHEVLHAIWSNQNLKNKETEENVILAMEVGLISLFRDNPGFLDWIKKGLK